MKIAVYPGSFDPVTNGHLDVIKRSAKIVDELIVGVLNNNLKSPLFNVDNRVKMLNEVVADIPNVKVMAFDGLLVDFAHQVDAQVIIRGLRAVTDFEYELQMSQTNMVLDKDLETLFLSTRLEYAYLLKVLKPQTTRSEVWRTDTREGTRHLRLCARWE